MAGTQNRQSIEVRGVAVMVSPSRTRAAGERYRGFVRMRVLDELTGQPPRGPIRLRTDAPSVDTPVRADGNAGLAGVPVDALPTLRTESLEIGVDIEADGYLPVHRSYTFPADPNFPITFTAALPDEIRLRRAPVRLVVRVFRKKSDDSLDAVHEADVSILGVCRLRKDECPHADSETLAEHMFAVAPLVAVSRDAASSDNLRAVTLAEPPQGEGHLAESLEAGNDVCEVKGVDGIMSGDWLRLEGEDDENVEFLEVDYMQAVAGDRKRIHFTAVTRIRHRSGAEVRRVVISAQGMPNAFKVDVGVGDRVVFLEQIQGLGSASMVRIAGAGTPPSLHRVSAYAGKTDPDGVLRLPPLARVDTVILRAEHDGDSKELQHTLDYARSENRVSLTLRSE